MGQFVDKLTKPGLDYGGIPLAGTSENWGAGPSRIKFFNSPAERSIDFAKNTAQLAQPSIADVNGTIPEITSMPEVSETPGGGAEPAALPPANTSISYNSPSVTMPKFFKPTIQQATTDQNGLPLQNTPGATKLGKLFQILGAAAKGGLAGQAAAEEAVIRSGGHRSGGAGIGFEAGMEEPYREASMKMGAEREGIQNQVLRANTQPVPTPWGPMPMFRAQQLIGMKKDLAAINKERYVTPRNGGVYDTTTGEYAPGTEPQDKNPPNQNPLQVYADTVKAKMKAGLTGDALMKDPDVQSALQAYQATQKEGKPDSLDQQYLDAASKGDAQTMANIEKAWRAKATNVHITNPSKDVSDKDIELAAQQLADPRNLTTLRDIGGWGGAQRLKIFARAKELNPNLDLGAIQNKSKFLQAYEDPKGRASINRQAVNNILQHGADLLDLNNQYRARSEFRPLNTPINALAKAFGSTAYTQFATVNSVLKDELALYFAGGYAPSKDQQSMWNKIQSDEATPAQTEAFAREVARLALRRSNTFNDQFRKNMGYDDPDLINPEAMDAAEKMGLGQEFKKFGSGGTLYGGSQPTTPIPGGKSSSPSAPKTDGWTEVNGIRVRKSGT